MDSAAQGFDGLPGFIGRSSVHHNVFNVAVVTFNELKGQYLLIDFWASWCGPCRQENPVLVEVYKDYNDRGFEIVGVSLDESREKWVNAIVKDGLPWIHVSDLKYWQNDVSSAYGVKAIPHTVLVDPEGIIIAKNLRGKELRNKLKNLFSE